MKKILFAVTLLLLTLTSFSKEKKPKLEKGLYAEIETNKRENFNSA